MHDEHGDAGEAAEQGEGLEQAEEAALVDWPQVLGEVEGHALQQIAEGDAEDQRRDEAADEECPVTGVAPARPRPLVAEGEADRAQDERSEHDEHGEVEAGECRGVEQRPGREGGTGAEDQPDLMAFPMRLDALQHLPSLAVAARRVAQQHAGAEIVAVGDGEADEQYAEQRPPDEAQYVVIGDHTACSCGRAVASLFGPRRIYLTSSATSTMASVL